MILSFLFILGLAVGSFLNVLIDRLPNDQGLLGRSHCDYCKKTLQPQDLIPVFSYAFLRGRCRYCQKRLQIQYSLIELLTGVVFMLTWLSFSQGGLGYQIYTIVLISILIAMFFSDLKYQILPDEEQLALFIVGLAYLIATNVPIPQIAERFVLSFVAMMPLLLLFLATKGRGMGFGDVKLLFIFGFLFELQGAFIILYVAFITGGFFGLVAILLRKTKMKSKIAFGPFLILGAILYLFYTKYFITEFNTILGI
ncbi:MAG: prepilin peptidase [Microgenomates group bacterium]